LSDITTANSVLALAEIYLSDRDLDCANALSRRLMETPAATGAFPRADSVTGYAVTAAFGGFVGGLSFSMRQVALDIVVPDEFRGSSVKRPMELYSHCLSSVRAHCAASRAARPTLLIEGLALATLVNAAMATFAALDIAALADAQSQSSRTARLRGAVDAFFAQGKDAFVAVLGVLHRQKRSIADMDAARIAIGLCLERVHAMERAVKADLRLPVPAAPPPDAENPGLRTEETILRDDHQARIAAWRIKLAETPGLAKLLAGLPKQPLDLSLAGSLRVAKDLRSFARTRAVTLFDLGGGK
jgi:hypothetical protein